MQWLGQILWGQPTTQDVNFDDDDFEIIEKEKEPTVNLLVDIVQEIRMRNWLPQSIYQAIRATNLKVVHHYPPFFALFFHWVHRLPQFDLEGKKIKDIQVTDLPYPIMRFNDPKYGQGLLFSVEVAGLSKKNELLALYQRNGNWYCFSSFRKVYVLHAENCACHKLQEKFDARKYDLDTWSGKRIPIEQRGKMRKQNSNIARLQGQLHVLEQQMKQVKHLMEFKLFPPITQKLDSKNLLDPVVKSLFDLVGNKETTLFGEKVRLSEKAQHFCLRFARNGSSMI